MTFQVVIDPEVLSQSYIPEKLLHREKELSQLLNSIRNSINTLVCGHNGIGKTALTKRVINASNGVYVDCSLYQTTYSVLREILPSSKFIVYRSNYELIKALWKRTRANKFAVCLDHFEHLKDKDIIGKLISTGLTVLLVSDSEELPALDAGVRSNIPVVINLQHYTTEQVFDIIKDRAKRALAGGSFSDSVIRKIAEQADGNIPLAMNALKVAALKAEGENKKSIEELDVVINNDRPLRLSEDEKVLLRILEECKSLPSSRLFGLYVQRVRHPKGERAFRNYMQALCSKGLVVAVGDKRGRIYEIVGDENASGQS